MFGQYHTDSEHHVDHPEVNPQQKQRVSNHQMVDGRCIGVAFRVTDQRAPHEAPRPTGRPGPKHEDGFLATGTAAPIAQTDLGNPSPPDPHEGSIEISHTHPSTPVSLDYTD